jgi:opacity protein-like surface antigen
MKNLLLIFVISVFGVTKTNAQYLEYGLGLGTSVYWGDLNAPDFGTNIGNTGFAVQGMAKLNFSKYVAVKANLLYGKLSGDDSRSFLDWQKQRNLNFTSSLAELSVLGELHIFGYNFGEENPLSPYITAGLGVFHFNPKTTFQGNTVELQPLGTEGQGLPGFASKYSKVALAIPFGAGAKFQLTNTMNISLDVLARKTFTDYIDDVSTNYVAFDELAAGNGVLAAQLGNRIGEFFGQPEPVSLPTGSQRGGAKVKDYYFTGMLTLTFKLNRNIGLFGSHRHRTDCPKF